MWQKLPVVEFALQRLEHGDILVIFFILTGEKVSLQEKCFAE